MLKRLAAMAALLLLAGCSSAAPAPTATVVVTQTATVGGTIEPSETPTPTPTVNAAVAGATIKELQRLAGHTTPAMAMRYQEVAASHMDEVVDRLGDIMSGKAVSRPA